MTRRGWVVVGALTGTALLAVLLALFQPWQLFTTTEVHDAQPAVAMSSAPSADSPSAVPRSPSPTLPGGELARGSFISYEHETKGVARLLRLDNGSLVVRFENFSTSNGPDVRVWLSDRPADQAGDVLKGAWFDLGPLKGNRGELNYPLAAGAQVDTFRSVVVWCRRFSVPFGSAALATTR